jgi:glutamate---cysteine ligase / carboxylate-amine ligase
VPDALTFAESDPLTIGIEEEFALVEAGDGCTPAPRADQLLEGGWRSVAAPGGWFKPELLRSSIELATAASVGMLQVDVDLCALRDELVQRAQAADAALVGLGMHPDQRVEDAAITPTDAHAAIAELHRRVGTLAHQATHGIHVHVGMPDLESAVRVMDALAGCVPLFIACTANSPVAEGRRAPWRSMRSEVQRRMLWAGPTPRFSGVDEYCRIHALHQLENQGDQRFLWEVAPVPALGTVEVRAFDASAEPAVALGMATLVQAIAALVLDGGELERAHESLERHNRWSAMEFGPRARFLVEGRDEPTDAVDLVRALVERVRPYARDLDNEPWLDVIDHLLDDPPSDRAIDAFEAGGVPALMDQARLRPAAAHDPDSSARK